MTDRERLLEILNKPIFPHEMVDPLEAVADYLLDNGVTFQTPVVPGHDNCYDISEMAYKNGYTKGLEDGKPKWIPVTERLPNCNGCYLVWRPHFFCGEIGMPSICYFDGSNTWHDSYGVDFTRTLHPEDVTYWMPLPEPPKEE